MNYTIKAEIHCHANRRQRLFYCPLLYDSVQSEEEILKECLKKNIKILAITDHDSMDGYHLAKKIIKEKKLDILLIPSIEVSAKGGHVLAYNIKRVIPRGWPVQKVVDEIHNQGGIAVAAHPYMVLSYKDKVFDINFDAIEGYNSSIPNKHNHKAVKAAKKMKKPCIAGSDAHQNEAVGNGMMLFPKSTETVEDVMENILKANFKIEYKPTSLLPMIKRHIYRNINVQVLQRI